MEKYAREELSDALQIVASIISKCEKIQLKFEEGTSQHTLLKNRIKAMYISLALITYENVEDKYTKKELVDALTPVASIISKCEKAQLKSPRGTAYNSRLKNIIEAMYISKVLISNEISKRDWFSVLYSKI